MRRENKPSDSKSKRVFFQDSYIKITTIFLLTSVVLMCVKLTIANTSSYTVDSIADGMLAAEAKFTNLRLEYTFTRANECNEVPSNIAIGLIEGIYAHKVPSKEQETDERLRYLDLRVSWIDNVGMRTTRYDTLASFNGEETIVLDRIITEPGQPMRGTIRAGYNQIPFVYYQLADPHTVIWYFSRTHLGNFLRENRATFHIESQSELLDGIPTVKLVGTTINGRQTTNLWISPEWGFLPLKRKLWLDGKPLTGTALYDLVQLPNGMWYPQTIRHVPGDPNAICVSTTSISKISIEPIPVEFFTPEFPPNTRVVDEILGISYTTH
jgi:hypothetical protein